jgi:3-hydroxy-9,10-secoandrosta-1,3,5(10)-triene-9,17-dione monooxygenase reductase component
MPVIFSYRLGMASDRKANREHIELDDGVQLDGGIHYTDPFRAPEGSREPVRRFRGRLTAGVTIWTANGAEGPQGLTMSSVLVAEGEPPVVVGLLGDTADLFEALEESQRFVVHILDDRHKRLADRFAGLFPSPGGLFSGLSLQENEYGPVLQEIEDRAYCELIDIGDAGYQRLVRGSIQRLDLSDLSDPLTYFRGRYHSIGPRSEED